MTTAPDIFLSYNREDQARAKLFAEAFEAQGFNVWWDVGLRTGEAYDQVTEKALREAKAVVVLWSKRSVESRWVRAEATLADRNKTLLPCMIEPCERPIMFELTQTAELSHWHGDADDRAWQAFLEDLARFITKDAPANGALTAERPQARRHDTPSTSSETLLAVLPFDNLSSDPDMGFFSDGVSEDILSRIARGSKLKVIGRTSSFQFRGPDKPKAASALSATHILDGSIRRAGAKVRIAAHLTEAWTQTTLWSDRYDRSLEDIFAVQDEISEAIAQALNTAFFPPKSVAVDPAVYDLYLKARVSGEDFLYASSEAIATLERITQLAPTFASGLGTLAYMRAAASRRASYQERAASRPGIEALAAKCLAIDDGNIDAMLAQFLSLDPFGEFQKQAAVMKRASAAETSAEPNWFLPFFLESVGRSEDAVAAALRIREFDALSVRDTAVVGMNLWRAGRYREGVAAMEATLNRWPDTHEVAGLLLIAYAVEGNWEGVTRMTDPERLARYPLRQSKGAIGFVETVRDPTSRKRQRMMQALNEVVGKTGHLEAGFGLVFAAKFGFADEAYALIERARLGPSGAESDWRAFVAYSTAPLFVKAFPELRADPRFVQLCARLGLVEYWLETQQWPDCASEVPYDFRAECERYRGYPKDKFFA